MKDYMIDDSGKRINEYKIKTQKALLLKSLIDLYCIVEVVGGSLHIVLDDSNYEQEHIEYCLEYAKGENDIIGIDIANKCLEFTESELELIVERGYEIVEYFESQ
tara:strand:+ start:1667 stop:1981 length:315 start_codon:yes stop_codon:yes gene_type:complete